MDLVPHKPLSNLRCPNCGKTWPSEPDVQYCGACAEPLPDSEKQEEDGEGETVLLEEERKTVTVLFADLKGFTEFAENRDPERVRDHVFSLFDRFVNIVESHGGKVDKVMGDAVMAIFGAPVSHEDDPRRAISTALEMFEELERANEDMRRKGEDGEEETFSMRIGINTGDVIWGRMADGNMTVMGDAVNVAERLESEANPGEILVSKSTRDRAESYFHFEVKRAITVEGRDSRVQPFQVLSRVTATPSLKEVHGKEVEMLGRETEFQQLLDGVEQIQDGQSVKFIVTGSAGVGKSRLLEELVEYFVNHDEMFMVPMGTARSPGNISYAPFREMLRRHADLLDVKSTDEARRLFEDKLKRVFQSLDHVTGAEVRNWIHLLAGIAGVPIPEEEKDVAHLEPEKQKKETFRAVLLWLRALAVHSPVVVQLDNVHQLDQSSLDLLKYLTESLGEERIMLLCAGRDNSFSPEQASLFLDGERFRQIQLEPLREEDTEQIVRNLLNGDPDPSVLSFVKDRAAGNPYFVEEILRYLLDMDIISTKEGKGGKTRIVLSESDQLEDVPGEIRSIIGARLDRLERNEKNVLKGGAVVGRRFWRAIVEDLLEQTVVQTLKNLEKRELILPAPEANFGQRNEYLFRHKLLRDVAYSALLKKHRRKLHRAAAKWIHENMNRDNHQVLALEAHNWEKGGEEEKAVQSYREAAKLTEQTPAVSESISNYQSAYDLSGDSQDLLNKVEAQLFAGNLTNAEEATEQLEKELQISNGLPSTLSRNVVKARRLQARVKNYRGEHKRAERYFEDVLTMWKGDGTLKNKAAVLELGRLVNDYAWFQLEKQSNIEEVGSLLERTKQFLESRLDPGDERKALIMRCERNYALYEQNTGQSGSAAERLEDNLQYLEEQDEERTRAVVLNNLGMVYNTLNRLDKALEFYRVAISVYRRIGDRLNQGITANNIGAIYQIRGDLDRAEEKFNQFLEIGRNRDMLWAEGLATGNLAVIYRKRGELELAEKHIRRKLSYAEDHQEVYRLIEANMELAMIQKCRHVRRRKEGNNSLFPDGSATVYSDVLSDGEEFLKEALSIAEKNAFREQEFAIRSELIDFNYLAGRSKRGIDQFRDLRNHPDLNNERDLPIEYHLHYLNLLLCAPDLRLDNHLDRVKDRLQTVDDALEQRTDFLASLRRDFCRGLLGLYEKGGEERRERVTRVIERARDSGFSSAADRFELELDHFVEMYECGLS